MVESSGGQPSSEAGATSRTVDPSGQSDAQDAGRWPTSYRRLWIASIVVVLAVFLWIHLSLLGPRTTQIVTDLTIATGATLAALALTRLAWRQTDQSRTGWRLLAVGAWFEATGEITWTAYTILAGGAPYPGLPDVFYLLGYPFLGAGFVLLANNPDQPRQMVRLALDGFVVGSALLLLGWHFVLEPILAVSTLDSVATWVTMSYPIVDILVGSIAFVIAANARGHRRVPLLLIAAGILAWAFGDTAFAYLEFTEGYTYTELALSWLVGDLAIALGALHPAATAAPKPTDRSHYEFVELVSPYAPFLVAMTLMGYQGVLGVVDGYDFALAGVVILALLARQSYVLADATRLSHALRANERTITQRNQELLLVNRIVRHDIRNDMAVAYGWAGELYGHVDDEGERMLDRIRTTTHHTIELTETLRDFVAALDDTHAPELEPVSLPEALDDTLASRRETYPEATFTVHNVPDVTVRANALLGTVFRNLLNNAVQHNDTDDPHVDVSAELTDTTVVVRIADDGPGIPDDRKQTIFGRNVHAVDTPGTGVGLYLVETLVDQYDGTIHIEDNDPTGTIFVVELQRTDQPPQT